MDTQETVETHLLASGSVEAGDDHVKGLDVELLAEIQNTRRSICRHFG
jgi:hypothetical protein